MWNYRGHYSSTPINSLGPSGFGSTKLTTLNLFLGPLTRFIVRMYLLDAPKQSRSHFSASPPIMLPVRVFIRLLRRCWVSAFQHNEWIKRLPSAEILRFQTRGACEVVSPLHGRSWEVRGRWHWNRGAGHPAAGAGDASVLSQPPAQSLGGAETGSGGSSPCPHRWVKPQVLSYFLSSPLLPRSSQTGRTRRGTSGSWSRGKIQTPPRPLATNQRSKS